MANHFLIYSYRLYSKDLFETVKYVLRDPGRLHDMMLCVTRRRIVPTSKHNLNQQDVNVPTDKDPLTSTRGVILEIRSN